jgi:hypothetical protein
MPDLQEFPAFVLIFGNSVKLIAPGPASPLLPPDRMRVPAGGFIVSIASRGHPNGLGATVCMR